jgi:rhodanese-related sulfurtransferase
MPPATTSTCGPRCWTPTATTPSARPATPSTRRWRRACSAHLRQRQQPGAGRGLRRVPRPTEDEQEILDTGKPSDIDIKGLLTTINRLHHTHDHVLLLTCNSGRRSLYAADLLRSLGYPKALSVAGGFLAWKKLQTAG